MRVVRKILSSVLLVLVVLVAQHGALRHELSHLVDATASAGTQPNQGPPHDRDRVCAGCLAFAHIAGVVHSAALAPGLLATADHWIHVEHFAARDADVPAPAARDPPILL